MTTAGGTPPRIERFKVRNFRALREVELAHLTPLTVLLGPNGSGKSTVFDVFAFLAECFESGLRRAWEKRGRARELKSRGGEGPVLIEIAYREQPGRPLTSYRLEVDEKNGRPVVVGEWLRWKRGRYGAPFRFLDYADGLGRVISGDLPDAEDERIEVPLSSPDTLAVNALGQLAENPRVVALRDFIMGWHVSYLSSEDARGQPEAGPQERLSKTGGNLANVIQYLSEEHPDLLESIFGRLRQRVPKIESVTADPMPDGRLLLQIKDAPFAEPVMARFASDGTLKMLAYLALLHDPVPPPFIGIEEPENFLHPRLLYGLAEECREAAGSTQILVTTHSPFFLNALRPREVRVLWRDESGYTRCHALARDAKVMAFVDAGAQLGDLWMEGQFGVGDPLTGAECRLGADAGTDMPASHFEFHVEEASMEAFLRAWLPSFLSEDCTFGIYPYPGKGALLRNIGARLRGYATWMPPEYRIVLIVDRDRDVCEELKSTLEQVCGSAGLRSRRAVRGPDWQVVTRIAIEELEAWYFGDWPAVCAAYPGVSANVPDRAAYRDPDTIRGGTWEAFERILQRHGYFNQGLAKVQAATQIGERIDPARNRSRSFAVFRDAIAEAAA